MPNGPGLDADRVMVSRVGGAALGMIKATDIR